MMKSIMTLNILLITMAVLGCCLPALGADDNTPVCPVTGATGAASTLPAMPPNHSATPGTMPATGAGAVGTISIQAVQRTKGGPAIGEDNVTILLIQPNDENGRPPEPKTIKIKLDKQGKADLKNLSLQTMFKPQVFVDHAGVLFDAAGEAMGADYPPSQKITVTVYETTTEAPKWELEKRVLKIKPSADGLEVVEMLVLNSPSDRVWMGNANAQGKRSWVVLSLPPEAYDVVQQLDDLDVVDGKLISDAPMHPGQTPPISINYKLPVKDGRATLNLEATVPVKSVTILMPHDKSTLQGQGVQPGPMYNMGEPVRSFNAPPMEAGQHQFLTISNLVLPAAVADTNASSSYLPRILVYIGGGLIVVLCIVMMIRPRKKAAAQSVQSKPDKH